MKPGREWLLARRRGAAELYEKRLSYPVSIFGPQAQESSCPRAKSSADVRIWHQSTLTWMGQFISIGFIEKTTFPAFALLLSGKAAE
jgi:hypothetical protein